MYSIGHSVTADVLRGLCGNIVRTTYNMEGYVYVISIALTVLGLFTPK